MRQKIMILLLIFIITGLPLYGKSARYYYERGKEAMAEGAEEDAINYFKKAIKQDSEYMKAYRMLFKIYFSNKEYDKIITLAKDFLRKNVFADVEHKAYVLNRMGVAYLKKNDILNAVKHLKDALRKWEKDSYKKDLQKAIKLRDEKIEEFIKKGLEYESQGNWGKALEIYRKAKIYDMNNPRLAERHRIASQNYFLLLKKNKALDLLNKAREFEMADKWDDAYRLYEEVQLMNVEDNTVKSELQKGIARYKMYIQKQEELRREREREEERKRKIEYLLSSARSAVNEENWQSAMTLLKQVLSLAPQHFEARKLLQIAESGYNLKSYLIRGKQFLKAEKYLDALSCFNEFYKKVPTSKTIIELMVECYKNLKQYDDAIKLYSNYLAKVPPDREPSGYNIILEMGDLYYLKGEYKNAIEYYNKYLNVYPTSFKALTKIADAYNMLGDEDSAIHIYKRILKLKKAANPDMQHALEMKKREVRAKLIEIYKKRGLRKKVLKMYRELLSTILATKSDEYIEYKYQFAKYLYDTQDYPLALIKFSEIQKDRPDYKDTARYLRSCYYRRYIIFIQVAIVILILIGLKILMGFMGPLKEWWNEKKKKSLKENAVRLKHSNKVKQAIAEYQKLLKFPLTPKEANEVHSSLAELYLKNNQFEEAILEAKKVLNIDRNSVSAHYVIASVHLKRKDYEKAIQQCRYVFDFDVANPAINRIMQQAYKAMGNLEDLLMEYEELVHMNPDNMQLRNIFLQLQKELMLKKDKSD